MNWVFLMIAYLPVISIIIGVSLLLAGIGVRRGKPQLSKRLFRIGGACAGVCLLIYAALFLAGALGIGPVPN